jgi:hypothetical protein
MYKPLSASSVERLLPNINKIANNSITNFSRYSNTNAPLVTFCLEEKCRKE